MEFQFLYIHEISYHIVMKLIFKIHKTALHIAVQNESLEIIKLLLKHEDINIHLKNQIFHNFIKFIQYFMISIYI